jgi:hypothetical protein
MNTDCSYIAGMGQEQAAKVIAFYMSNYTSKVGVNQSITARYVNTALKLMEKRANKRGTDSSQTPQTLVAFFRESGESYRNSLIF